MLFNAENLANTNSTDDLCEVVLQCFNSFVMLPVHVFLPTATNIHFASGIIYARVLLEYVNFIVWVRSFSKMLPYVKFAEDKVLVFVILHEKCKNSATVSLTLILTLISRAD